MAAENDPRELVNKYLADLHSLMEHGHNAIKRQRENLKDSDFPEALALVADFEQILDRHTSQLEAQLKSFGGNASSPVQDTASAVTGFVAGLYNAVRSEEASKSIRDDYTFFSHAAIASLMLYTTSKALGDEQTAMFANNIYRDTAKCIERVDVIMPRLIVHELKKDGLNPGDVRRRPRANQWLLGHGFGRPGLAWAVEHNRHVNHRCSVGRGNPGYETVRPLAGTSR